MTGSKDNHVVVIGCGNIGSHLVPHLARMREVERVTLIDRDVYETSNLPAQDIVPSEVGKAKALVQARRLRRINPELQVEAIAEAVENVALGKLKSKLILSGLDSKRARQIVNEKTWQLGATWVDAGVDGAGLLARVSVYFPGPSSACGICNWHQSDFDAVEAVYPCADEEIGESVAEPPATGASSSVGALAASLQAIECQKLLAGGDDPGTSAAGAEAREGREILVDASGGNLYSTRLLFNPECAMPLHRSFGLADQAQKVDVCSLAARIGELASPSVCSVETGGKHVTPVRLQVIGQPFVTGVMCEKCGTRRPFLRLKASLQQGRHSKGLKCRRCNREMVATGFDTVDELDVASLSPRTLSLTLENIGVREGDVMRVKYAEGGARTIEIGRDDVVPQSDSPKDTQTSRRWD